MVESRWLRWIGPGLIALGGVGAIVSTASGGARLQPWATTTCTDEPAAVQGGIGPDVWFELEPQLDGDGALRGQRLTLSEMDGTVVRAMDLPAESFAAGPFGGIVLVGADDGALSRVDMLDVERDCWSPLDETRSIVRRATLDEARGGIIEMRVDRASREDLGIWFRPLDGRGAARRILGPIEADARFGRTWSTEFAWDAARGRLAIQSCGEAACRTRILAPDTGATLMIDQPDLGLLLGVDDQRVITYGACLGLPCPVVSTDVISGDRVLLVGEAGAAALVGSGDDQRLVYEADSAAGRTLRSVSLGGGQPTDLGHVTGDLRLMTSPGQPDNNRLDRPRLRHMTGGRTVLLSETLR
ncbi:MAG: hypothetical protein E4H24_01290 [Thermomicrobiales bacterium]|jgi:hypothetical protein|nr:MAG: hypothetical protein E4H24_01290 [Thermomicrobiales bacterium]